MDTDSDGTPNYLDEDSDDDGKLDSDEGLRDDDCDGVLNYVDADDEDGPCGPKRWSDLDTGDTGLDEKPEAGSCSSADSRTGTGIIGLFFFFLIGCRSKPSIF